MIQLTQEELWAFSVLNTTVQGSQVELTRQVKARDAFIKLLENKYNAVVDPNSGELKPKDEKTD